MSPSPSSAGMVMLVGASFADIAALLALDNCRSKREASGAGQAAQASRPAPGQERSEEHTSELQSLMRISYAVFCLKKKKKTYIIATITPIDANIISCTQKEEWSHRIIKKS